MRSSVEQMQSLHRPAQEDAVGRAEAAALEARQVAGATWEDCNTYVQNARRLAGEAQAAYERLAQQPPPPPRQVPRRLGWMIFNKQLNGGWRNVRQVPQWLGNMLKMLASLPRERM